jgi:hypothetical protein
MKGGVASLIGRSTRVATDVASTGAKKLGKVIVESTPVKALGTGAKAVAGLVYNILAEPYRLLRDMKTVGSEWYFQTKKFTYDTKATIDKNIEDLKNSITSTVYSDIKFFEFDTPKTYKYVMISMYEYVVEYWKRYPLEFEKNMKAQTDLFGDTNGAFFKDLYETYRTYEEYCKFIDGYVNSPEVSSGKLLKELNDLYIKYSPGLNHGVRIICGSNLYQLETAVKKKQKLQDEIKVFKRYKSKTEDKLIGDAIKNGLNDKFFQEILAFFKSDPDDFHKIDNYRSYYSVITDNENNYRNLNKLLKKKRGSIDDEVFNVLKSALDKMQKKTQISLFGSTNDGKSFYKRQEKFNAEQTAFNKTADPSVIRRNEKAIEELKKIFLSKDQNGGVNGEGAPPAEFSGISNVRLTNAKQAKQEKNRLDDALNKVKANQKFEEQNKQVAGLITQYKAYDIPAPNESSDIPPPEITKKMLEDLDSCVLFEDYTYVIREYARRISKEELDTWFRRLEEYNPSTKVKTDNRNKLNDSYYKEYKSMLNDLKEKLALRQFPTTFSRFLSKIKTNSEETKFITNVFNVAQKKTELEEKNDPRLNQASVDSEDKLKRSSDIFKDFLSIYDDASKIYNGEPVLAGQNGGAGVDDDLDNLYTKYNKYIDYFAKTFNRDTIQQNKSVLESYKDTLNSVYYDALTSDLNKIEQKIIERGAPVGVSDMKLTGIDQLRKIPFFDKIYTKKTDGKLDDNAIVKSVVDEFIYRSKAKGLSENDKNAEIQSYEKQLNQQLIDGKLEYDNPYFQLFTKAIQEFQKKTNSYNVSKVAVPRLEIPTPTLKRKEPEPTDEESDDDDESVFGTPRGPGFVPTRSSRSGDIEQRIENLESFMESLNQDNSSNRGDNTLSILRIFSEVVNPGSSLRAREQEQERGVLGQPQPLRQQVQQQVRQQAMMQTQTDAIRKKDQQIEQQQQEIEYQKEEINKQRQQLTKLSKMKDPNGEKANEVSVAKQKLKESEDILAVSISKLEALTSENSGLKQKVQEMEKNKEFNESMSNFKNAALLFEGAKKEFEVSLESEKKVAEASQRMAKAQAEAAAAQTIAASKTAEHAEIVSNMTKQVEQTRLENEKKIAELQATVDQAQAQAQAAETTKNDLVVSIQAKDEAIATLNAQGNPQSIAEKQALQEQLQAMQAQLAAATEKANAQEELLAKQQVYLEEQKNLLDQSAQSKESEIAQATDELRAEKDAAIAKAQEADQLKQDAAAALDSANREKEAELTRIKAEHEASIIETQREKETAIENLKAEHQQEQILTQQKLAEKDVALDAAQKEIESTKEALTQNLVQKKELAKKQTDLQLQLDQEQAKFAEQQATIKSLAGLSAAEQARQLEEANKSVEELKAELSKNSEQLASITEANAALTQKQTELGTEMETLKSEKGSLEETTRSQSELIETLKKNQRSQPVVVNENGTDAPKIITGILKSIRGGSDMPQQKLETGNTKSVFLTNIEDDLNIELKNCMYPSPNDKNTDQLRKDMITFSNLINKVIYDTPIIVMLNSLSFQEYTELMDYVKSQSEDEGVVRQNTNIIAYLNSFMEFVMFDTTQLYEFSQKDGTSPYIVSDSDKPGFIQFKQIQQVTYDAIHVLCENIDFVDKPGGDVLKSRNQGFTDYIVLPENQDDSVSIYKERLVVTHILETAAFFDNLIKKEFPDFNTLIMKPGVYSFINSLMYGRVMKLNDLIQSSKPFETCSVMCEVGSKDCPADEVCIALNNSFIAKVSSIIEERSPVSTYLILNNKGGADYNRSRFELKTDRQKKYLQVKYNGDDKSYDPSSAKMTDEAMGAATNFLFGKFDKIFTINTSVLERNQTISKDLIKIQEKLLTGDPVFVVGYGQSGAGKTSSLIYLNYKDETGKNISKNGVLIHLCNLLGKGGIQGKGPYTKLTLTTQEFYKTDNKTVKSCDGDQANAGCVKQTFTFQFNGLSDFILDPKQDKPKVKFSYRDPKTSFNDGALFGDVLKNLIDTDRFVKPTPNNPDSSRSHSLIYIKLEKTSGNGPNFLHLFIGDFAGVENKFDCENKDVLDKFLHLNIDRSQDKSAYVYASPADRNPKSIDPKFDLTLDNVNNLFGNKANFQMTDQGTLEAKGDENFEVSLKKFIKNPSSDNLPPVPIAGTLNYVRNKLIFDTLKKPMITQDLGLLAGRSGLLGRGGKRIKSKKNRIIKNKTRKIVMKGGERQIASLDDSLKNFSVITNSNQDDARSNIDGWTKKKRKDGPSFKNSAILWVMMNISDEISFDFYSNNLVGFFTNVGNNSPIFNNYSSHLKTKVYKKEPGNLSTELKSLTDLLDCKELDSIIIGITVDTSGQDSDSDYTKIDYIKQAIRTNYKKLIIKQILKVIKDSPNDYDKATAIIKYGKDICNERVSEGVFINDTLAQLRTTIFDIMMKKTKDIIYYSPQFYYQCLPDLCPSARDCFLIRPKKPVGGENPEPNSLIIKWIMNEYNLGLGISDQAPLPPVTSSSRQASSSSLPPQSVALNGKFSKPPAPAPSPSPKPVPKTLTYEEFCSKLHISLFCVFDISTKANNPPPIPYVNINELKKQWNVMQSAHYDTPQEFDNATNILIDKINQSNLNEYDSDVIVKFLSDPQNLQYNEASISSDYTKKVNDFIEKIERTNAATAIGTLEYLNSFAALNTINTSCIGKVSEDTTEEVISIR